MNVLSNTTAMIRLKKTRITTSKKLQRNMNKLISFSCLTKLIPSFSTVLMISDIIVILLVVIFIALFSGFLAIYENVLVVNKNLEYFNIPQNKIVFFDFIYKNVKIILDGNEKSINFAAHYKEVLVDDEIAFEAEIVEVGELYGHFGHVEYDLEGELFDNQTERIPKVGQQATFLIGAHTKIVNGLMKK